MTRSKDIELIVKRREPVVWISRLILFKSTKPIETIREIKLNRGMNIIWGVDEDDDSDAVVVAGHGVGKTSLCRLLRYCLGEATFGTKNTREGIRSEFPQGYVAAEIHVEGSMWAVARSIGRSGRSYARKAATIDKLLEERTGPESYNDFRQIVEDAVLQNLVAGITTHTKETIRWDHLLAWCARDQEARYQSLWLWRSPRSESATPALSRPKTDGLFLIRAVIGLLTGDEVELSERLAELEAEADIVAKRIAEARREPEYWCRYFSERLASLLGIENVEAELAEDDSLFGPMQLEGARRAQLDSEAKEIEKRLAALDEQIADLSVTIRDRQSKIRYNEALANESRRSAGELCDDVASRQKDRDTLANADKQMCSYTRVMIKECTHVQHLLETLRLTETMDDEYAKTAIREREAAIEGIQLVLADLRASLNELEQRRLKLIDQQRTLRDEQDAILKEVGDLSSIVTNLKGWTTIREGKEPNTKLAELQAAAKTNKGEQDTVRNKLGRMLARHTDSVTDLETIYDHAVKSVLSQPYSGEVSLGQSEVDFEIRHGTTMAGEAIVTLAVLLADVCAMLLGAADRGCHPSFVIHDSPREADLGPGIYRSYLRFVGGLHSRFGGRESAPFQYIITTTTAPPQELRGDEHLRLQLHGDEGGDGLLFRRNLGSRVDESQGDGQMMLSEA